MKKFYVGQHEDVKCEEDDVQRYVDLLNGIWATVRDEGYRRGIRNIIILDLTVGCVMVGIDPEEVIDSFFEEKIMFPHEDDEDTYNRMSRVLVYDDRFCWDYMIDPEDYESVGYKVSMREGEVKFNLS